MTARVLVIGLDAAEASLLERWADEGALPHLKALMARSRSFALANSLKTLPGAIWPELATGISCGKRAQYYHPAQLHTGEAERRPILAGEVDGEEYYWAHAARAGLAVAALDMPQTVLTRTNSLQLLEWGLHDRHMGEGSAPESFAQDIRRRYGVHPVTSCDTHGRSEAGYTALLEQLKEGVRTKAKILEEAMRRGAWDLFTATFGECHCVGHQFWHFQDPAHPWYAEDAAPVFKSAIRDVYALIDEGLGRLIRAAGPDCVCLVLASHGMGAYTGGPYLLPEILGRLGLNGSASETKLAGLARHLKTAQDPLSRTARILVRTLLPERQLRRAQAELGVLHQPLKSGAARAADLPNNRCGAIRLNLKGREPFGEVAPGNEATALTEDIRAALLALRQPGTNEPIIEAVVTAREAFGPAHHPDVPDLMVVFRDDLGRLEECICPQFGKIRAPIYRADMPRSGDHTTRSRLWAAGPAIGRAGTSAGNVLDLAPTVLSLLKVNLPAALDGRPLLAGC